MLTEILLEVTNQEIRDIAMEVYEDEKSKSLNPQSCLHVHVLGE